MSSLVGGLLGEEETVTSGGGLPPFAVKGLRESINAARGFLKDPSIFEAVGPTTEQQEALEILRLGAQPLTADRFNEQFDIFFNPFVEETLNPALGDLERLGRSSFGDIGAQATQAGAFGSTRQAIREAELGRALAQEAGRLSANVRSQAFESAADRALQQLGSQQINAASLFNAAESLRGLQQQTQQAPATAAEFLARLASSFPVAPPNREESSGAIDSSNIGGLLSGAGSLIGFLSDIRLKKDIKFIRRDGDYNIYQFSYLGQPEIYEGVMAHEVQKIKPEAVHEDGGYLKVDYSMIDPEFKEVRDGV